MKALHKRANGTFDVIFISLNNLITGVYDPASGNTSLFSRSEWNRYVRQNREIAANSMRAGKKKIMSPSSVAALGSSNCMMSC